MPTPPKSSPRQRKVAERAGGGTMDSAPTAAGNQARESHKIIILGAKKK